METLKHPVHTVGWVTRLLQLAFTRESNPNFPWEKSQWDNTVVKKKKKKLPVYWLIMGPSQWSIMWKVPFQWLFMHGSCLSVGLIMLKLPSQWLICGNSHPSGCSCMEIAFLWGWSCGNCHPSGWLCGSCHFSGWSCGKCHSGGWPCGECQAISCFSMYISKDMLKA